MCDHFCMHYSFYNRHQKEKELRLMVLQTFITLLKKTELPWDDSALIGAMSKILNSVATAFKGFVCINK